MILRKSDPW
jgi:hypothetical protein